MPLRSAISLTPGSVFIACVLLLYSTVEVNGQATRDQSPGAPGADAHWASAGKDAVGTSSTVESKVWFTLSGGALTEVYYPTVEVANVQTLQFVVVSSARSRRVQVETEATRHRIEILDARALSFRQTNTELSGAYTLTKTYTVDPERSTLLIDVRFRKHKGGPYSLYVYYDPSLNNSGRHDSAWTEDGALLSSEADKTSALMSSTRFDQITNGYLGTSDGLTELRAKGEITNGYARASDGNVVQLARLASNDAFTLALSFGRDSKEALKNARASLSKGFDKARLEYEAGWHAYVAGLQRVAPAYERQYLMAAMVLKAHEDKTHRGAMVASLTAPWGGGPNANEANVGGYHLVWARDLYQVATAFMSMGDHEAARRALDYLFTVQQKPDGSFPQNSWLDGRQFYGGIQMDQVAYPLVLAYQLDRADEETWRRHVKPAADFLIRHGPTTGQERWEEETGYSPSTIAAEIAGLVCAAHIARRNNDEAASAIYLAAADDWMRNLDRWTATSTGTHMDRNYYLRITENDDPDDGGRIEINSGGGLYDEREIVDAGFLELVRLGLKRADDPLIKKSLAVIDRAIKVETPGGAAWYRYNHDAFGERPDGGDYDARSGRGRLWTLLTGERGEYELALGLETQARRRLDAMIAFANDGMMIPEQVWDKGESPRPALRKGEGTGSATPLAWATAQFIRLALNIEAGRNLETPEIVAKRFAQRQLPLESDIHLEIADDDALLNMDAGTHIQLSGRLSMGSRAYFFQDGTTRALPVDGQRDFRLDVEVKETASVIALATFAPDGSTTFNRRVLRGRARRGQPAETTSTLAPDLERRLREAKRSPVIEEGRAVFFYRGPARTVEVVGDFTNWNMRGLLMTPLAGTDIKYYVRSFEGEARAEYKLIGDGQWMLDPLNDERIDNGVGGFNSVLHMPGYSEPVLLDDEKTLSINLDSLRVQSRLLKGERAVQVYLPPDYNTSSARYPVLYMQDGAEYVTRARAALIAANLIAAKRVAPFIIVFIAPVDRFKEYWANDLYADFLATELVPLIDARYRTLTGRDARAVMGASLGGVNSVWAALRHSETFARVGGQSSSFQIDNERVVGALSRLDMMKGERPFKFYFDVGRMESILGVNRRVRVMLRAKGYAVGYMETETGHNWTSWRDRLANAFEELWKD
jgi:glucan 1,4-alpha-glucosidase